MDNLDDAVLDWGSDDVEDVETYFKDPQVYTLDGETLPSGHVCSCLQVHKWPPYVYAHWDVRIKHTCDKCSKVVTIYKVRPY